MSEYIPTTISRLIQQRLDSDSARLVLEAVEETIRLESNTTPPRVDEGMTFGDWPLSLGSDLQSDYRNDSKSLSFDIIDQMLKSAPVRFALEMKRSQVVSVFRNERSWVILSPDTELAEIVTANLKQILPKMALDFSYASLVYGCSFQELVWEYKNKYQLGITNSQHQPGRKFAVAQIPKAVPNWTVLKIRRDKKGHFEGFTQRTSMNLSVEVNVPRDASLLIPYNELFRNLWGESFLKPMYPIWFWYEIVMRSMVRYMERVGTPVTLVRAPAKGTVIIPGTKERIDAISWAMEVGTNVARSNVAVIPSDTDDQGKPLWDLSYLASTEKSQPFMDILELLTQMILRAGLSADRALSQSSGGTGSYNIGEIHQQATALHNELILTQWVHYLNTYFLPLYSLYNRGQNGPPIWLETQGLDPLDKQNLISLIGTAQSMESFKEFGYRIDWEGLLTVNNIPLLSQAEADSIKTKIEEENLASQEAMLATQAKFETPSPTKGADDKLKANLPNKAPEAKVK